MQAALTQHITRIGDQVERVRQRAAALDVGKVSTRLVGGAVILTASFLVVATPDTERSTEPSAVVAARIAPIGTVQLARPATAASTPDATTR